MDIVVTYDCLPKIGGAHTWLYEVYRRWASCVPFYTTMYSRDAATADEERAFDAGDHGSVRILRSAHGIEKLNLLDVKCLRQFAHNVISLRRIAGRDNIRLHSLRAFPEGFTAYLYSKLSLRATKLITYAHGEEIMISKTSRQLGFMTKRVYAASDLIIVNSENTRELVRSICPDAPIVCIHPGVESTAFKMPDQEVAACRQEWGWPVGTVVLCTVARMEARKNHVAVIRAVATLREEGLPVAYVCGGDGPERAGLERLARSLGMGGWVSFTGAVSERSKRLILAAADIHIMPSIRVGAMIEGFGIVFLEAAAAGKPSICGRSGGQAEAVQDGVTGIVVDGQDDSQICFALRRLAGDPGMRQSMGEAGLAWAAQNDWSIVTRITSEQIEALARAT